MRFTSAIPVRGALAVPEMWTIPRCNAGSSKINSGLASAEGTSPVPNSFHDGGVNMAYADGHVTFLSETVNGAVYAALASMRGSRLQKSPLAQVIVSDLDF